jgi:sulfatase-like protein
MKRSYHIRYLLTAFSLSNLCFITAWRYALSPPQLNGYHLTEPSMWKNLVALMLDVLLLAAILWVSYALARHRHQVLVLMRWVFLFVVFAALDGIRLEFYGPLTTRPLKTIVGKTALVALQVIATLLIIFVLVRWSRQVISIAQAITLILSPFVFVTFSQATWPLFSSQSAEAAANNQLAADAGGNRRPTTRLLWIIFDEFDYHVAFAVRPSSVTLPEFDRLRAESIVATNAYPPAKWTMLSMPALITGKLVSDARPSGYNELMLAFDGASEPVGWSTLPNVFSRTRETGGSTAVLGWYHPYCRVIGSDLNKCSYIVIPSLNDAEIRSQHFFRTMVEYFRMIKCAAPRIPDALSQYLDIKYSEQDKRSEYVKSMKLIGQESVATVADDSLSLTLIHFPAPHSPYFYDRRKDDFSVDDGHTYLDNLKLVDRTLGEMRRAMEQAGLWDNTVVLISGDHWWRFDGVPKEHQWTEEEQPIISKGVDQRVPFILKLKGQKEGVIYHPAFNTILSHDLILALLQGEASTPSDVTVWLDRYRSIGKSAY